jgi:hypothetical protein
MLEIARGFIETISPGSWGATKFSGGSTASAQGVSHGSQCLTPTRQGTRTRTAPATSRPLRCVGPTLRGSAGSLSCLPVSCHFFAGGRQTFPTKTSGFRLLFLSACHLPGSSGLGVNIQILLARRAFCSSFRHQALNRPEAQRRTTALTEQPHPQDEFGYTRSLPVVLHRRRLEIPEAETENRPYQVPKIFAITFALPRDSGYRN